MGRRQASRLRLDRDYMAELEERTWRRVDVIRRVNNILYNTATGSRGRFLYDVELRRLAAASAMLRHSAVCAAVTFRARGYTSWLRRLAAQLNAIFFIRPEYLKGLPDEAIKAIKYIKYPPSLSGYDKGMFKAAFKTSLAAGGKILASYQRLMRRAMRLGGDWPLRVLDIKSVQLMPTVIEVLRGTLQNYGVLGTRSEVGKRILLCGDLGSGKTTLAFYTFYTVFRVMMVPEDLAVQGARSLIVINPYEGLILFRLASSVERDFRLPGIVFDDIASSISKYWLQLPGEDKKLVGELVKKSKISREGIGFSFYLADRLESVPRGFRESTEITIEGESIEQGTWNNTMTIWFAERTQDAERRHGFFGFRYSTIKRQCEKIKYVLGTVSPPFWQPKSVYDALDEEKREMRARMTREEEKEDLEFMEEVEAEEATF